MLKDINPYNEQQFREYFVQTDLYKDIAKDYDEISWSYHFKFDRAPTPRQEYGEKRNGTKFSVVPFYYINMLTQRNPNDLVYDVGCGWNIFKRYIPNLVGIGAEPEQSEWYCADIHDFVDDEYIQNHQGHFASMFSINALHFVPLSDIRKRVIDLQSMLKPGGTAWHAFNLARMWERDNVRWARSSKIDMENFVRQELDNLPFPVLAFDLNFDQADSIMDGNIRIVVAN